MYLDGQDWVFVLVVLAGVAAFVVLGFMAVVGSWVRTFRAGAE